MYDIQYPGLLNVFGQLKTPQLKVRRLGNKVLIDCLTKRDVPPARTAIAWM